MEYLFDYLSFSAKFLTAVVLLVLPLLAVLLVRQGRRRPAATPLEVEHVNAELDERALGLESALLPPAAVKQRIKQRRKSAKQRAARDPDDDAARTFVCTFEGDLRASAVSELREIITAIIQVARADDTVVVVLESGGGTIHGYGLAASQLRRLREAGLRLVVVVDRIAASGGYMMACVADELVAAPFAIIGSIGVIAQLPNFNRLLKKHDIDFEQVTAGKYKRTLTLFGENTDEAREKFQDELDEAHALFKEFVADARPQLDVERVGTGEYWLGTRALELGLVDRVATSDEVICSAARDGDVYRVSFKTTRKLLERLGDSFATAFGKSVNTSLV